MKAEAALQKPGDVARRESDGAVAVWMYEFGSDPPRIVVMKPHDRSWWPPGQAIPGDDWQPLHPAGELADLKAELAKMKQCNRELMSSHVKRCFESTDHAAEVKRLTAERDMARRERDSFREKRDAARAKGRLAAAQAVERERAIAALTARVKKLEYGIHNVLERAGYETWSKEATRIVAYYWDEGEERAHDIGTVTMGILASLVTAPPPTAGDEEDRPTLSVEELEEIADDPDDCPDDDEDPAPAEPDSKEIESATPDKRAAALHRQGRGVHSDLLRPVHGLADEGEEVNTRPTDGMSDETAGRILDMVLDDSQCNAYKLPLGTRVVIGKRRWRLVERDAGHPDHMRFDETTTGESYPETGRVMYPSEVQWCIDQGCEVIPPAEPDSPAEERRKPSCLDGVPAVLCEDAEDGSKGWGVSDAVTKWMNEAPPEVRQLFQSIHVINFFHDERRRSFQVPRSNDGAISKGAEQLFQECYETCDAIIKAVESWRN